MPVKIHGLKLLKPCHPTQLQVALISNISWTGWRNSMIFSMQRSIPIRKKLAFPLRWVWLSLPRNAPKLEISLDVHLECMLGCVIVNINNNESPEYLPYPVDFYLIKVSNESTRKMCELWWNITIKTLEQHHWRRSGVFIVHFEQTSHIFLVFSLLILNKYMPTG